jgi:hypothetical protein
MVDEKIEKSGTDMDFCRLWGVVKGKNEGKAR